jgi:drug/metabolite transporter (DMT)-like permease
MLFLLPVFGSIIKSWYQLLQKQVLNRGVSEYVAVWSIALGSIIMSLSLPFLPSPRMDLFFWAVLAGSAIIWVLADLLEAKALQTMPVSVLLPITSLGVVASGIVAWAVLGETPTALGLLGVLLILVGIYLIELKVFDVKEFFLPFKLLFSRKGTCLVLLTLPMYGLNGTLDKMGVVHSGSALYYMILNHLVAMGFFSLLFYKRLYRERSQIIKHRWSLALLGTLNVVFAIMFGYLYKSMDVLYVVALSQLTILFNAIGGHFILKEEEFGQRFAAAIFVVLGTILLFIA